MPLYPWYPTHPPQGVKLRSGAVGTQELLCQSPGHYDDVGFLKGMPGS